MRHPADGVLRRLADEPLAVPDRISEHTAHCRRCTARQARMLEEATFASRLLSAPQLVPDTDGAWARFERELHNGRQPRSPRRHTWEPSALRRNPFARISLRTGLALGAAGTLAAGVAAAATLTTIFAPTHVAPLAVNQADMQALTAFAGLNGADVLGGFSSPSGSRTTRFGTLDWASTGEGHPVASLAQASAEAGFPASLPTQLPAGVGAVRHIFVQPRVGATLTFDSTAGSIAGSTVTLNAGPAVMAVYGGTASAGAAADFPTLAIATMPRPTAVSSGATMAQIESFVLAQPGIPPQLAEEIRLLGDVQSTLPVPVPSGAGVSTVRVDGSPGVMLTDSTGAAAGVVWEDASGMVHFVAGLLDTQDVLNVASQLG